MYCCWLGLADVSVHISAKEGRVADQANVRRHLVRVIWLGFDARERLLLERTSTTVQNRSCEPCSAMPFTRNGPLVFIFPVRKKPAVSLQLNIMASTHRDKHARTGLNACKNRTPSASPRAVSMQGLSSPHTVRLPSQDSDEDWTASSRRLDKTWIASTT